MTILFKLVVRGFLVMFRHLQAIEHTLGMSSAEQAIQFEIDLFDNYREGNYELR